MRPLSAYIFLLSILHAGFALAGDCLLSESTKKIEGVDCKVLTLSNEQVQFEIIPQSEGELSRFKAKDKTSALQYMVDCFYNTAGRWEGAGYDFHVDSKSSDKLAVTVSCSGKIPEKALEEAGVASKEPVELKLERTMTLLSGSNRVQIDVKITNIGKTVAPALRYMPRISFGNVPAIKNVGSACWFLPDSGNTEFFTVARGNAEMAETNYGEGASADHPFSRFTPGRCAERPRYEAGGWAAVLTSVGTTWFTYEPTAFDFLQYTWYQEHSWELGLEPQTKKIDLQPGASISCSFALALDSKDIDFKTPTVSFERPALPATALPGDAIKLKLRAIGLSDKDEHAKAAFELADAAGKAVIERAIETDVKPLQFAEFSTEYKLPENLPSGQYAWSIKTPDNKNIASGKIDVRTQADIEAAKKSPATPLRISPQRLAQLKKGLEWSYIIWHGNKEDGGTRISLKYDSHEKTFTYLQKTAAPQYQSDTTLVFTADEKPELKSFSIENSYGKHRIEGHVSNGKLIGNDQDGDPIEIPYHSEFLPDAALNFVLMITDWSSDTSLRLQLFDQNVQDFLPTLALSADRSTRMYKVGGETVACTSVISDRSRVWIDQSGRIVEFAPKDSNYHLRLGEPKPIAKQDTATDSNDEDEADTAKLSELLKHPPVTGVVISQVVAKSQASKVGLAVGDVILKYGGNQVATRVKLEEAKRKLSEAKSPKIEIEILRDDEKRAFTLLPGMIGIQTIDLVKDQPVDMVTAQYGSMGFGPGPRPAPSPLEVMARDKCGSLIPWIKHLDEARKLSQEKNKVLLWWASPIHGSATYKIDCWNDYLITGLFTDPWLANYINHNFVPYTGPLSEKQMESYKLGFMTAPAFVFLSPEGEVLHEIDGLSTISVEYYAQVFQKVLKLANRLPQTPEPKERGVSATLNYIEALLADNDPARAASEAKKAVDSMVGDDRAEAHYLYGRALEMLHKEDEAVAELQLAWDSAQSIRIKSSSLAEWALTHLRAGHPDRALKALRQPLAEYLSGPRAIEARYLEGVALHLLNRDQEGRRIWKAAAESSSKDPWAWRCAAEYEGIGPFDKGFDSIRWVPDDAIKELANIHSSTEFPARDSADAVRMGVRYLLENQSSDGGWNDTNYDFGGLRAMPNVRVAVTAICCEALLAHRDTNPRAIDAALDRAWPYLIDKNRMVWDDKNEIIWAHMYRMNYFAALLKVAQPERRPEIVHQMQLIANAFEKSQNEQGFWRHEYENDFVTGSVLLSLKFAKDAGVSINDDSIEKGIHILEKLRSARGTYPYGDNPSAGPVAWKGCTGRTVNAEAAMLAWGRSSAERLREAIDKYVQWNFVQERVRKETFHTEWYMIGGFFFWYNMHVLSQSVHLTDNETAKHAAKSMREVVLKSREFDGTWVDSYDLGKSYATGMALLVLATADAISQ